MTQTRAEAVALAEGIVQQLGKSDIEVAVAPPSVYLDAVGQVTKGSGVGLSAQNMYHEANGAFTGEISASMLLDVGCKYVILGHSERRHILGETDADVNRKVHAALAAGLIPIVCVGEKLEEREAGHTKSVVQQQCDGSLAGLTNEQMSGIVIAYEPVWAIGTGLTASPAQAQAVHAVIRSAIAQRDAILASLIRILYGGSVKGSNAAELFAQADVDGGLIGGASLVPSEFAAICRAASQDG